MKQLHKARRTGRVSSNRRIMVKATAEMYAWAKPYTDSNINNVVTGLGGNFRYSPIFKNTVADTFIELTGYRNKDYKIAEAKTGKGHTPKVTVWHHAWQEKDGLYRMQLVDFSEHKKTCPHAGGCKLWIMNTHKKKKYAAYRRGTSQGDYTDIPDYYEIDSGDRNYYQRGYVSKKTLSIANRKKAKLVGIDMYGNLFYKSMNTTYFWDHECDILIPIGRNVKNFIGDQL